MMDAVEAISLGVQACKENDLVGARAHYGHAATIYREAGDQLAYAHAIRHIADTHRNEGNLMEARPLYEEALELYRGNLGTKLLELANTVRPYALLQELEGNAGVAKLLWEEARNLYASLRVEAGVAECEAHVAKLH